MRPVVIIQSTLGRVGAPAIAVVSAVLLVVEGLSGGALAMLRALPWLGLVSFLAWLLWDSSRVVLDGERLVIANPLSTTTIGWAAVQGAESRWGLVVQAQGRDHKAWAAPARGSASFGRRRVDPQRDLQPAASGAAPLRMDLDARAAALLIGEEAPLRAPGTQSTAVRTRHLLRVGLLSGLALLCLLSTLV